MIRINLLPEEYIKHRKRIKKIKRIFSLFVTAMIVLVVYTLILLRNLVVASAELESINVEIQKCSREIDELKIYESKRNDLQQKIDMITAISESGLLYPKFMEDLLKILPRGIRMSSLVISSTQEGLKANLSAMAPSNYEIADLISNIEKSGVFFAPVLEGSLTTSRDGKRKKIAFTVSFNYRKK